MIVDLKSLPRVQAEWKGVVRMRNRMADLVISTFTYDPMAPPPFGDVLYNFPLLLAFGVLKLVLIEAREKGQFPGSGYHLIELIESAKEALPWIDWQGLRQAVDRQDEITHDGRLFGDRQYLRGIADIEDQLLAWGIIAAA